MQLTIFIETIVYSNIPQVQDVSMVVFMLPVELDPPQPWVDPTLGCLQWKYRRSLQSVFCTIHHLQDIRCFIKKGFSHSYSNNLSHLRTSSVRQVAGSSFLSHHHFKCAAWCPRRTQCWRSRPNAGSGQHGLVCIQLLGNIRLDVGSRRPLRDPS